jgi:hypothetical protein
MEKTFPYMEKLLQAPNHDVSAGFFQVSRVVGKIVGKGTKCRLNQIAATSKCLPTMEKAFSRDLYHHESNRNWFELRRSYIILPSGD